MTVLAPPAPAATRRSHRRANTSSAPNASRLRVADLQRHGVEAEPFRAWVRQLMSDTGLPWRVLARAARVPSPTVQALLYGRDGRIVTMLASDIAERLFRLDHHRIAFLTQAPAEIAHMRILLWSLAMAGCTNNRIAEFSGIDVGGVRTLMAGDTLWCSQLQELRAEAACEAWGIDPRVSLDARASA